MSKAYCLSNKSLPAFLGKLSESFNIAVPVKSGQRLAYREYNSSTDNIEINQFRSVDPLKAFYSRPREIVARGFSDEVPYDADKPLAVVGVKACDLKGFKVQDHVFDAHGAKDPIYSLNRERGLIISSDCTSALGTCFCLAMGIRPYPESDYDINLSQINGGYLVTVGADKGAYVVDNCKSLLEDVSPAVMAEQEENRNAVVGMVEKNIHDSDVPCEKDIAGAAERNFNSPLWEEEARRCVECGACNTICPTCHCFLLYDQIGPDARPQAGEGMARFRIWDSCMLKDFARVAGGGNPRKVLWMRLRNRFEKKFDYFPKVAGLNACTGCGRCISACPAKIDIRRVLRRLANNG